MRIIAIVLTIVICSSINAVALRSAPRDVPPVQKDGIEYRVNHDQMGFVEAWDMATRRNLWRVQVYKVEIRNWMEEDVQWVFITKLFLDGDSLTVENENQHVFRVNLATRAVTSSDASYIEAIDPNPRGNKRIDVTVRLMLLSFSHEVIDELLKEDLTASSLLDEWRQGRGALLSAPLITTPSGEEACLKGVREYIYPTELAFPEIGDSTTSASNSVRFVVPSAFETREVGTILSVLPQYMADLDLIDLTLRFEYLPEPEWRTFKGAVAGTCSSVPPTIDQPIFRPFSLNMSVRVPNGDSVLLAGGVDVTDGKSLVYIVATATTHKQEQ
jgi:hypothetical protein